MYTPGDFLKVPLTGHSAGRVDQKVSGIGQQKVSRGLNKHDPTYGNLFRKRLRQDVSSISQDMVNAFINKSSLDECDDKTNLRQDVANLRPLSKIWVVSAKTRHQHQQGWGKINETSLFARLSSRPPFCCCCIVLAGGVVGLRIETIRRLPLFRGWH